MSTRENLVHDLRNRHPGDDESEQQVHRREQSRSVGRRQQITVPDLYHASSTMAAQLVLQGPFSAVSITHPDRTSNNQVSFGPSPERNKRQIFTTNGEITNDPHPRKFTWVALHRGHDDDREVETV